VSYDVHMPEYGRIYGGTKATPQVLRFVGHSYRRLS
jgi:hypothetical protein